MKTHSVGAFEAANPAEAVDYALQLIDKGKLPSFFLRIDGGAIAPEIKELLADICGLHGNVGSCAGEVGAAGNRVLWETKEVTPCKRVDGMRQYPRGRQVILDNRKKIEKVLGEVLRAGGKVVVEETTETHRVWLDSVVAEFEER